MKLENQVTSLEISKKLRELGVKQDAVFSWGIKKWKGKKAKHELCWNTKTLYHDQISAFTVAELGEMLPCLIQIKEHENELTTWKRHDFQSVGYKAVYISEITIAFSADTEADARGKMLIYLLENKLIII